MKRAAVERDADMHTISEVRKGHPERLFPELYNDTWQRSIVANAITSIAEEFAEMIAPLPALTCSTGAMKTEKDKKSAALRNKIGAHYWLKSNLAAHMFSWCDAYSTYAFAVMVVEPDYASQTPLIRTMPSVGSYYRLDRWGNTIEYAYCTKVTVDQLAAQFPEFAPLIRTKLTAMGTRAVVPGDEKIEVVQYVDKDGWKLFLPDRADLILAQYDNLLPDGKVPVRIAERPSLFATPQGKFDDVVWVHLAKNRMALLSLEAGQKAVGAPLAVPRDVSELAVGPDAVIVTESPEKVRRVPIDVPPAAFQLQGLLDAEMRMGTRYPEGRAGGIDASVITGRGVQALMGSFDTQISVAQTVIGQCLARVTEMAFQMDVAVWPNTAKRVTGSYNGEPYDFTYKPAKDVGDTFSCEVTYGFAAGLAPNAAAVMLLQLRGDRLIDRATVQRNLPFSIDPEQMSRNVDAEELTDALKQGLSGLLQGLGPMAANGVDPSPYLRAAASVIAGRNNGRPLEQLLLDAFSPEALHPQQPGDQGQPGADQGGGGPAGGPPGALPGQDAVSGLPSGITPGQAGMPPGGAPDLQTLVAGMRRGHVQMDASVSRRLPVG